MHYLNNLGKPPPVPHGEFWVEDGSGMRFRFWRFPIDARPIITNAVYGMISSAGLLSSANRLMYLGRAERLDRRLSGHEKLDRAKRLGANELWVHQPMVGDPIPYWQVESRLIKRYSPPLNENEPSPFPPLGALFGLGHAR